MSARRLPSRPKLPSTVELLADLRTRMTSLETWAENTSDDRGMLVSFRDGAKETVRGYIGEIDRILARLRSERP